MDDKQDGGEKTVMWHGVTNIKTSEDGSISADADIPMESAWFSGHFPQNPILPGIAQMDMVHGMVERALGGQVSIKRISRIRFKKIIRPGDRLEIKTSAINKETGSFSFSIMVNTETVCSGNMMVDVEQP